MVSVALPGIADASPTAPFNQCPGAGQDTSCGVLITVNSDGSATVSTDPTQPSMNSTDGALVGIVNDSNASISSVGLSGAGIFAFDGEGVCAEINGPCLNPTEYGPTGYEGPGTSFTITDSSDGSVNFPGGFYPGKSTYFSLQASSFTVSAVNLAPGIVLTVPPITATVGNAISASIASFTDGSSTAAPSDFTATVDWGDGSSNAGTVSQTGSGKPYVVTGGHTYATQGNYTVKVTVTDTSLVIDTASGTASATVTDASIIASPVTIASQTVNKSFTSPVATFTDANPAAPLSEFTASVQWGDGSSNAGTVSQPGGVGTVFDVSGTHTYTTSGTDTVIVTVSDGGGSSATASETVTVANTVIKCSGSGCSGSVTTPTESLLASSTSTTGSISASLNQSALNCGDPDRHAPQTTTITDIGIATGTAIDVKVTFLRANLTGPSNEPVEICYQSTTSFIDLEGKSVYLGLLPTCASLPRHPPKVGPCYKLSMSISVKHQTVSESLVIPSGDPKWK
jgi:hypothetical protein